MQELARYEAESGKEIVITDDDIKWVLAANRGVTNEEMKLFIELCVAHKLDPFIREAYIIKYGSNPATIVVGKEVWLKRAMRSPRYRGHQAGITVLGIDGRLHRREGSMLLDGEVLIGGWARVFLNGFEVPIYDEVSFEEYKGTKKDGSLTRQWAKMPGTMIRKVALVHALREAFPDEFSGCYDAAEMGVESPEYESGAVEGEIVATTETVRIPVYEQGSGVDGWEQMDDSERMAFVESVANRDRAEGEYGTDEMRAF